MPGKDIKVIGVDATADGFKYLISGKLECRHRVQPAPRPAGLRGGARGLNGDTSLPKWVPSQEGEFFAAQGADALNDILATRKY